MTQRIATTGSIFNDRPFAGDGASLYLSAAAAPEIVYRNLRVAGAGRRRGRSGWIKGASGVFDITADSVLKTNRVAFVAAPDTFTGDNAFPLPPALWASAGQTVEYRADVRVFADDVENENGNDRTFKFTIDENGDIVSEIKGTAAVVAVEQRAAGVVWIRVRFDPAIDGTQPNQFTLTRTAGPTTPADVVVLYAAGEFFFDIETAALSDAAAYTFDIIAEDTTTATTKTVVSGLDVTADASGPVAPINGEIATK